METASKCPCGMSHVVVGEARAVLDTVPANVNITTLWGTWSVPRIFIAAHGLAAVDLPALAMRYGFEKVIG